MTFAGGVSTIACPAACRAFALTLQSDLTVLVGVVRGSNDRTLIARTAADGSVDSSFGVSGAWVRDLFPGDEALSDVAMDGSGRILAAGRG